MRVVVTPETQPLYQTTQQDQEAGDIQLPGWIKRSHFRQGE